MSFDDKFTIEVSPDAAEAIKMRNLGSNQIVAKFEGHSAAITNIKFSQKSYEFVSSAGSEFLLWDDHTKNEEKTMKEVV